MRNVFKDKELEARFQREGYVIIPFLSDAEVADLKKEYFDTLPRSGGNIGADDAGISDRVTYDFTFIDKNIEYKKLVYKIITDRFKKHVDAYLDDYTPLIANFIRKKWNDGEVPLHQNWAFVDETKCTSVSIWCPLVDSNESNGTLQIVPGSHKRYGAVRGPMVPWELENIKHDIIRKYLVPMNIKAGEAVVLDDSVVHYSAVNKTDDLRLAIQLILMPAEETSIHYHMNPAANPNRVDVLKADVDFYMEFNPWKKPEHVEVLKTLKYKPFDMSVQTFEKGLFGPRIDDEKEEKVSILEKIKGVFS